MANVGVDVLPTLLAQSPWIAEDLAQVAGALRRISTPGNAPAARTLGLRSPSARRLAFEMR